MMRAFGIKEAAAARIARIDRRIDLQAISIKEQYINVWTLVPSTYCSRLATFVMKDPLSAIKMFQDQLNSTIKGMQEDGGKVNSEKMQVASDSNFPKKVQVYYVNFDGNFGKNHVTPRGLKADLIN